MKCKHLLLMLLLALVVPWTAMGQQTLTVHDGTTTNGYVPVYGYYADAYLKCEMVYPSSELTAMSGGQITALKFYASQSSVSWGSASFKVFVTEVSSASISAFNGPGTVVHTGALSISGSEMTVTFTSPYTYNGGNLLVGVYNTAIGSYVTSSWYGETVSNASYQGYSYSSLDEVSGSQRNFLPKTTFTYLTSDPYISVSPSTATVLPGATQTLTATYGNATNPTISWSSSNTSFATVSGNGTTATVTGVAVGNATITATMTYNGTNYTATSEITVSNEQTITIGDGTTTGNLPLQLYYNYGLSQQIYTAEEIEAAGGGAGTINSLSFSYAYTSSFSMTGVKMYLLNTDKAAFTSNTDMVAVTDDDLVWTGTFAATGAGWIKIDLDTPFEYDGGNLIVCMYDPVSGYPGSGYVFHYTTTSNYSSVIYYSDSQNPDLSNINTYSGSKYYYQYHNNIQLGIVPSSTPKPTHLIVSDITSESATVTWQAPSSATPTGYAYSYKKTTDTNWPADTQTSNLSVSLANLDPTTEYDFRVKANYAAGSSDYAETTFTTDATCLPVTNITVSDITTTSAKLAWDDPNGATSWQYICVAHGATPDWNSELVITTTTHANVPANILAGTSQEPQPNTEYDFYVRANCGNGDFSDEAMLTFRTACGVITALPVTYGFETSEGFPTTGNTPTTNQLGACWRNEATYNPSSGSYPTRVWGTSTTYKHGGSQALILPDKGNSSSSDPAKTMLVFPAMDFTSTNGYIVSFWVYRYASADKPEGFKVYASDTDTISANAVELGHYSRNYSIAYPVVESASGWYKYETPVITMTGTVYIIFEGQSYYGNASYVDDIIIKEAVTVTAYKIVNTVSDPVDEMTWDDFVTNWNNGAHFTHTEFQLMENIEVTTMVGTSENPFTGTFEGNSKTITVNLTATDNNFTAPFRIIKNATIQNLKVNGTIYDDGHKFCAGFAGDCYGNNTFTNCLSDVTINATIEGDGTHGGFIARNYGSGSSSSSSLATTTFNGCVFTGKLLGSGTNQCGGFCGWSEYYSPNYARTTFNNCVFDPAEVTMNTTSSATFSRRRNASYVTFNNCYYKQDFNDGTNNTGQGKLAHTITGESSVTVAMSGTATEYDVSGVTAYATGMVYGDDIIAGSGDQVALTLSGSTSGAYQTDCGTLTNDNSPLTMGDCDAVISQLLCPAPTSLTVSDINGHGATLGWNGTSESYVVYYREASTITYDFEDGTQGWTTIDADGYGDAWARYNSSSTANNGSYCMQATYNYSYAHQDYLVSPQIPLGGSISFYAKRNSTSWADTFRVYLSTGGNTSASDFTVELTDGNVTPSTSYTQYTYDLSAYSGTGYVAIVYTAAANQAYLYVDDITITSNTSDPWQTVTVNNNVTTTTLTGLNPETLYEAYVVADCGSDNGQSQNSETVTFTTTVACPAPTNLSVPAATVTNNSAVLSWTDISGADEWQICLNGDESNLVTANTNPWTLEGLTPETAYTVKVRANCGGNDGVSAWSNEVTFTTLSNCAVPTNLAANNLSASSADLSWDGVQESYNVRYRTAGNAETVTEAFTDVNAASYNADTYYMPDGWQGYYTGSYAPRVSNNSNYSYISNYSGNYLLLTCNTDGGFTYAIMPRYSGLTGMQFYYTYEDEDTGVLTVGYVTDNTGYSTYSVLQTMSASESWMPFTLSANDIATINDANGYIAFRYESGSTTYYSIAIDNVAVTTQTTPAGVWDETNTGVTIPLTIDGLERSTTYEWQVQGVSSDCTNGTTEWSATDTFTTERGYTVTVSVDNSQHGSASITYNDATVASPAEITPGDDVTVTATASTGYAFVNWTEDGNEVSTDAEYTIEDIAANHTLVANFEESKHLLTIAGHPGMYGTVTVKLNGVVLECTNSQVELGENAEPVIEVVPTGNYTVSSFEVTSGAAAGSEVGELSLLNGVYSTVFKMGSADAEVTVFFYIPQQDISFDVIGYEEGEGHWYLFTSPLSAATRPADVANLFADNNAESEYYDLYRFDQTQELEWRNYKQEPFDLVAGTGYLYANDGTSVLYFHGTPYDGDGVIEITNEAGHNWSGYNLVGNPYNAVAWSSLPYYRMNDGAELVGEVANGNSLQPMEGFFVYWDDATEPGTVTVSTTNPNAKSASLTLNISRGRGLLDRAIVSFGNNNTLPKFQLNPSHTKVYIPREDRDYAIVSAEDEMGEMPVSFKAEKSGSYTISVTAEGVSFGYLHLIDNMTGNDVDLLQTSSYTFDALDTDYASRFKLVFATGAATGDNFAFYSNGSWVISNEGEATLQVIDVTGRVLSSERVSGCTSVGMSAAPGVYMLRLVNGDSVRVQKVVVR